MPIKLFQCHFDAGMSNRKPTRSWMISYWSMITHSQKYNTTSTTKPPVTQLLHHDSGHKHCPLVLLCRANLSAKVDSDRYELICAFYHDILLMLDGVHRERNRKRWDWGASPTATCSINYTSSWHHFKVLLSFAISTNSFDGPAVRPTRVNGQQTDLTNQ